MNKITRKLFISVLTLAFALVTLGATTFAWFTLTAQVTMETIDLNIIAGEGIEISVDGANYRRHISNDELLASISKTSFPVLQPVTSENGHEFVTYTDVGTTGGKLEKDDTTDITARYLEFRLWFKSPNEDLQVYLDTDTKIESAAFVWRSDATFTYSESANPVLSGGDVAINAANALRFSFEEFAVQGDAPTRPFSDKVGSTKVFEFSHSGSVGALNYADMRLDNAVKLDGLVDYWYEKLGANPLVGGTDAPASGDVTASGVVVTASINEDTAIGLGGSGPNTTLATLNDKNDGINWYGYVKVRIWLEGWDPDNFDAIMGKLIQITFAFKGYTPPQP